MLSAPYDSLDGCGVKLESSFFDPIVNTYFHIFFKVFCFDDCSFIEEIMCRFHYLLLNLYLFVAIYLLWLSFLALK